MASRCRRQQRLADLGLGGWTVVICTALGLQEITLPGEGDPDAPGLGAAHDCLLVHALTPERALPASLWQRLIPPPRSCRRNLCRHNPSACHAPRRA